MGASVENLEFIPAKQTVNVNGRHVAGPVYVARSGRVRELSFLTLGADDNTSARIAAEAAEGTPMNFEQWLKAKGFDAGRAQRPAEAIPQGPVRRRDQGRRRRHHRRQGDDTLQAGADDDDDDVEDPVKAIRARSSPRRSGWPRSARSRRSTPARARRQAGDDRGQAIERTGTPTSSSSS
jgi:hypothetical protein